ncbi:MAG TPA: ABC-F family ATP-binding cassette domain-containing protein [Thermodesulfovibrionales bacterium]|nr:ABC-F family ATP-binding cassette domain-containing protein [Thermodesulfovibrionales bacterium]
MIQVSSLQKAYGGQVIFDDAGFSINAAERVGLVGRNGSGKTTLFRLIIGEEHPDSGVIGIPNDYLIGHISQHIRFSEDTVLKEGCLGIRPDEDGRDETYKVGAVLLGLGFSREDFGRSPSELSGGYQVRLNLAKVLVSEPNLLLLDEPTNYLDITSIRWLTKFLRNWKNELILITHDRDFMDSVTTHTMGIHRARVRKITGTTHQLYEQILQEEEIYEQTRINDEKKRKETEQFINRFRAQANKARAVQSRIKALQKREKFEKLSVMKTLDFEFSAAPFTGKQLIGVEDLAFSFDREGPPLIEGFGISVGKHDRIALIGKNGKGKTTLLNLLAGELPPLTGTITRHPHLRLAYFGQTNIDRLDPQKTVEEEILDVHPDYSRGTARKICGAIMFEGDRALKKIDVLSGGERSRVLLGKLFVSPANLLLLDEPTNHLDMESIDSLIEALDSFRGAVLIVTHSEMILHALATRLIVFDGGKVTLFAGSYQDFLERVGWKEEDEGTVPGRPANGQCRAQSKRDLRRIRAAIITDRSKTLGPLQTRIAEIEKAIIQLEKETELETNGLLEASVKSDGNSIKRLSKSLRSSKAKIDTLFDELASLTAEHDAKQTVFDERLSAVNQEG